MKSLNLRNTLGAALAVALLASPAIRAQEDNPPPRPQPDHPELNQPLPEERQKALMEQYGEQGIDENGDGVLTRAEVFKFFREHGIRPEGGPPPGSGRPGFGRPGDGPGGPGRPGFGDRSDNPQMTIITIMEQILRLQFGANVEERLLNARPEVDTDLNGKLSPEERTEAIRPLIERLSARLIQLRKEVDLDEDGKLSEEELAQAQTEFLKRVSERILNADKEADVDKNGVLSAEEYLAFRDAQVKKQREEWLKRFPQADKDQNGVLDDEEARAIEMRLRASQPRPGGFGPGAGPGGPPPGPRPDPNAPHQPGPDRPQP